MKKLDGLHMYQYIAISRTLDVLFRLGLSDWDWRNDEEHVYIFRKIMEQATS